MKPEPTPRVSAEEDTEFRTWLKGQIKEFNNQRSAWHQEARAPGYVRYLSIPLLSESGDPVGGLSARIYWGWLAIDDLYVPEDLRGSGLGSRLLTRAEAAAREAGCQRAMLETFSFQAPGFYQKQGYRVIGEIPDYPPGDRMLRFMKDLS